MFPIIDTGILLVLSQGVHPVRSLRGPLLNCTPDMAIAGGPRDKLGHMPMSDSFSKVEVTTGVARRRRFSTDLKLAVVAETMQPGMSISYVARRHGLSPSLVFRWRRLMSEGGREAVRADDEVVPAAELRRLEERVRDLERLLGRKTMENEILKEALDLARAKKAILLSNSVPPDGSR
jgi:transposase